MGMMQIFSKSLSVPEKWELISITYAPPRRDLNGLEFQDESTRQMALFGVTTYFFQETNSGKTKKEQVLGSDKVMLDELVNKVELYGPQNFKSEITGKIYTLKNFVEQLPVSELPIRYEQPQFNQTPRPTIS